MDELERDLRSTFDRLAAGAAPSDGLIARTLDRHVQLRRRRRVIAASSFAGVLTATIVIASVAGAGTRGAHVQITTPPIAELTPASTTTAPPSSTTTDTAGTRRSTTTRPPTSTPTPTPTTLTPGSTTVPTLLPVPAACNPPVVVDDTPAEGHLTLLSNGDIRVDYFFITLGPIGETHYFVLDDGTRGDTSFSRTYSPAEFGSHWYDEWTIAFPQGESVSCTSRHNFNVDPSIATPDTTPETTVPDTTIPPDTTVPDNTTVPETTTSIG
jgi:hypothetical protein